MKWTPKKDTIGVPGEGFIAAKDFTLDHLKDMVKRALNRKIPVDVFLSYSLRPANSEDIYVVDDADIKDDAEVEQKIETEEAIKSSKSKKVKPEQE